MASVPTNEGSVKNDLEINAMALKIKENYQKNATAAVKIQAASPVNVDINRASRAVTLANAPITTMNNTQKNNQDKIPQYCEDVESIKGKFSWELIAGFQVPYIIRVINGELIKFVSVRMAETHLLSNYLHCLHEDIYTCTSVRSNLITDAEAKLLNEINQEYVDYEYGKEMFFSGKDYIVRLEDVREFHTFIEVCYNKLMSNITSGLSEKFGYIRINFQSVMAYCIKDCQKYVPLFYFEGDIENMRYRAVKLENWNLAYLKFCCKVQGISNELFASESCTVVSLDVIKNNLPPGTHFEEYWPAKQVIDILLINQNSNHVNPSGAWFRAPTKVVPAQNTVLHPLMAPAPVLPQSMPVMRNTYQNGWLANEMCIHVITHSNQMGQLYNQQANNSLDPNVGWERILDHGTSKNPPYKIQSVSLQGIMILCINAKPYIYSDLMMTLDDLVQLALPSCTVARCAYVLNKCLKITVFSGNSEQLALLRENGRLRSMCREKTPMAMLEDIIRVWLKLKKLVSQPDEQIRQYQSAGGPSKNTAPTRNGPCTVEADPTGQSW